ncbi:hypothetical protein D3C71_2228050 [compost metagenome]
MAKTEGLDQTIAGLFRRTGSTDQGNNPVQMIQGDPQTFQDMCPGLSLTQFVLCSAADDNLLVLQIVE